MFHFGTRCTPKETCPRQKLERVEGGECNRGSNTETGVDRHPQDQDGRYCHKQRFRMELQGASSYAASLARLSMGPINSSTPRHDLKHLLQSLASPKRLMDAATIIVRETDRNRVPMVLAFL
jgi:hypothetical protein